MPKVTRRGHAAFGNSHDLRHRATAIPDEDPPTVEQTRREIWDALAKMHETSERPTPEQIARMKAGVRQAVSDGKGMGSNFPEPVVYYMRVGNRIKIGYSQNLASRMVNLAAEELLGYEPGDVKLERHRHRQFAAYRIMREWFADCPVIRDHIATL